MNFKRKLWWAQHKTNVYKYGTILSLVLIVTISIIYFTYSKFSSRNEATAYETTVEPFIKNDYFIASYVDGVWSDTIPGKDDGYIVDKIVCDNGATATWDDEEWGINVRNATKKIKCGVYFEKLITFTVRKARSGSENYSAEKGMTWSEFVNSSYNTGKFVIYEGEIMINISYHSYLCHEGHAGPNADGYDYKSTGIIIPDAIYTLTAPCAWHEHITIVPKE